MSDSGVMAMWTVYDHPKDFPHCFVARMFVIENGGSRPTENAIVSPDLGQLRALLIGYGLVCIDRSDDDEAQIVETWL